MASSLIKLPREWKGELKESKLKEELVTLIKGMKKLENKRLHPDSTERVAVCVENNPDVIKYGLEKDSLVIDILKEVFSLNDDEIKFVAIQLEDLRKKGRIYKIPFLVRIGMRAWTFLKKAI